MTSFTGTGIIFTKGYEAGSTGTPTEVGLAIIRLFEKQGFVKEGTADATEADQEFTWLTEEMCPRYKRLPGVHFCVREDHFLENVAAISETLLEELGEDDECDDEAKIPILDISILDVVKPLDHDDGTAETNLLLEFTYEETRGAIQLRGKLPLYRALKRLLKCTKIVHGHATIEPDGMRVTRRSSDERRTLTE